MVRAESASDPQTARLFFAFWPSQAMQMELAVAAEPAVSEAEKTGSGVRRVPANNFHLTLAFLGAVPLSRLPELEQVAARCARSSKAPDAPVSIVLDSVEHWCEPQVLVATSRETPPSASAFAETLKRSLAEQGFRPDLKPFRAHATVARKVRRVTRELHIEPVRWRFDFLHLIQSRSGAYSTVKKWVLDK